MANYFKDVKGFEELKSQFKVPLKENYPDNGGDAEVMKEINVQFDVAFAIWKKRVEGETGTEVKETADGTRSQFYTQFGWEGSRHDWGRSLKEIAKIVRAYVKEKYPTYKFSVRTSYASMCQELHVDLKESPIEIYKAFTELTADDMQEIAKKIYPWDYLIEDRIRFLNASKEEQEKIIEESTNNYGKIMNEVTKSVIDDVDGFVKSYNCEDCDGMIDYFDVDFYYFGCCQNNGRDVKVVPKTARIKKTGRTSKMKEAEADLEMPAKEEKQKKERYTYEIRKGEDSRDGSELWIVRIAERLDRKAYLVEHEAMKGRGAYYSRFNHGFLFRCDPTELLQEA